MLLYMSRDYVGDMAETVSLLWPAPEGQPADLDDGTLRLSNVVERLAVAGPGRGAGRARRACSTISTPAAASPC